MPWFRYKAVNRWGDPLSGEVEAADVAELTASLDAKRLELREVESIPDPNEEPQIDEAPDDPPAPPPIREAIPPHGSPRLRDDEARELVEQIAGLSAAGLPLHAGLRAAAEEVDDGNLRGAMLDLADRLAEGALPAEAIEAVSQRIPEHLRGLVLAAAGSGRIGQVLGEFVSVASVGAALQRSLWLALLYPMILVLVAGSIFAFAAVILVPGFKTIYMDFGVDLPILTRLLINMSDAVVGRGLEILVLVVVGGVLATLAARFLLDPLSRRRLLVAIPGFGSLWRWTALAEFSHYLALLVDCELTLSRALPLAARGARDPELEWACERVADEVENGRPLSEALAWWSAIPQGLVKLLRWSEGHHSLSEALHMAGAMFETRARSQAAGIGAITAVITVVLIFWGIALMVVALFLPLIRLISLLSG